MLEAIKSILENSIVAAYVQTLVGIVAIYIAIRYNKKSDKQYYASLKNEQKREIEHKIETEHLLELISKHQIIAESQIVEIKKLSRPLLYGYITGISVNSENVDVSLTIKNAGKRFAINTTFQIIIFNDSFDYHSADSGHLVLDYFLPETEISHKTSIFCINSEGKCIYTRLSWVDPETSQTEYYEFFLKIEGQCIALSNNGKPLNFDCSLDEKKKIREFLNNLKI